MLLWAIKQLAIWGALAVVLYGVAANRFEGPDGSAPAATAPAVSTQPNHAATPNSLVYRAAKNGHVQLDGIVNGSQVHFLVDTGATYVVLTMADAAAAGYSRGNLAFNVKTATANGEGRAAAVKLREIRIGQFSVYDVPAFISENLSISLLGQSFLNRLDSYEMRDGVLTMNWN
jgi:aspartyl protease family protein